MSANVDTNQLKSDECDRKKFNIDILKKVEKMRKSNGLIYNDYKRYHHYLSLRIKRIRKSLKFHGGMKSKSYHYRKPSLEQLMQSERMLELPLLLSERSMSRSFLIASNPKPYSKSRLLHHQKRKLAKSATYGQRLVELCAMSRSPIRCQLQAFCYFYLMKSMALVSNNNDDDDNQRMALRNYCRARFLLEYIKTIVANDEELSSVISDELQQCQENIEIYRFRLEEGRNGNFLEKEEIKNFQNGEFKEFLENLSDLPKETIECNNSANYFEQFRGKVLRPILLEKTLSLHKEKIEQDPIFKSSFDDEKKIIHRDVIKKWDLLIQSNLHNDNKGVLEYLKFHKFEFRKAMIRWRQIKLFEQQSPVSNDSIAIVRNGSKMNHLTILQKEMIEKFPQIFPNYEQFRNKLNNELFIYQSSIIMAIKYSINFLHRLRLGKEECDLLDSKIEQNLEKIREFARYSNDQKKNEFIYDSQYLQNLIEISEKVLASKPKAKQVKNQKIDLKYDESTRFTIFYPIKSDFVDEMKYEIIEGKNQKNDDNDDEDLENMNNNDVASEKQQTLIGSLFSWFSGKK